jgi:hypothetical protein
VTFAELPPAERVALAERHLAQIPPPLGSPQLGISTLERMRRLRLALCDDRISDEEFVELLGEWNVHLGTLEPDAADAARYELKRFGQILDGLRGPEAEEAGEG